MSRFIKTLAAAIAFAGIAAPAALAEKPTVTFITVSYGDLDVSRPAGAEMLLSRISTASKKVCGKRPVTVMNGVLDRHLACRASVISETVRRINEPGLSLAWQAETGAPDGANVQTASR